MEGEAELRVLERTTSRRVVVFSKNSISIGCGGRPVVVGHRRHAAPFDQRGHVGRSRAEPLAQHLDRVLAHARRRQPDRAAAAVPEALAAAASTTNRRHNT